MGYYTPVKPPPAFKDVRFIALLEGEHRWSAYGYVITGQQRHFAIEKPPIQGEEVGFSTKTVNGMSYTFRGRFVERPKPIEKDSDRDRVILVGTLTRLRDKVVVAEASLQFSFTPGD